MAICECVPVKIPDGFYFGEWSGHVLRWVYDGQLVQVNTIVGVRGIRVKVRFDVLGGLVVEKSIEAISKSEIDSNQ